MATGDHRSLGRGLLRRHTGLRRTDPIELTYVLLVWLAGGLAGRLRHGPAAHPWLSLHCSRPAEAPCDRPSRLTFVLAWPTICAMSSIGTPAYHRLPQEVDNGHPWLCRGWRRTGADPWLNIAHSIERLFEPGRSQQGRVATSVRKNQWSAGRDLSRPVRRLLTVNGEQVDTLDRRRSRDGNATTRLGWRHRHAGMDLTSMDAGRHGPDQHGERRPAME